MYKQDPNDFLNEPPLTGLALERSQTAHKNAAIAAAKALARVRAHDFTPPTLDWDELVAQACERYVVRNARRKKPQPPITPTSPPADLNKIAVIHLVYATGFADEMNYTRNRIGALEARELIIERAFEAIIKAFPRLHDECVMRLPDFYYGQQWGRF